MKYTIETPNPKNFARKRGLYRLAYDDTIIHDTLQNIFISIEVNEDNIAERENAGGAK